MICCYDRYEAGKMKAALSCLISSSAETCRNDRSFYRETCAPVAEKELEHSRFSFVDA